MNLDYAYAYIPAQQPVRALARSATTNVLKISFSANLRASYATSKALQADKGVSPVPCAILISVEAVGHNYTFIKFGGSPAATGKGRGGVHRMTGKIAEQRGAQTI